MALHFLDPPLLLADPDAPGLLHRLELYEENGVRLLRIWISGREPGARVIGQLTRAQALALQAAAEDLVDRITD